MKKPSMLHSDAQACAGGRETAQTEAAAVNLAKQAARAAAHFDFHEASAISVILPLRNLKRLETRAPFTLPRCALLGVLLVATLSAPAQSLWRAETSRSMVSDHKARAIGDVLTIIVQENNTASKDNTTSTKKDTSIDAAIATFLYSPAASGFLTKSGEMPAIKTKASQSFDGGGKIKNEEKITSRIGVRVMDVLPNGNLLIEGQRSTSFSGETQDVVLRGVVRAEDITPNNTIYSYNIADATIKYVSKGAITDNQQRGWFTRIWQKLTPF
jgi:flagellar L-ring protein FlgH